MVAAHVRSSRRVTFGTELFNIVDSAQRDRWNGLLGPTFTAAGWQEGDQIQEVGSGLILQLRKTVGQVGPRWQGVNCNVFLCFSNANLIPRHRFVNFTGSFGVALNTAAGGPVTGLSMSSTTGVGVEQVYILTGGVYFVENGGVAITPGALIGSTNNGRSVLATAGTSYVGWSIAGNAPIGATCDLLNFKMPVAIPAP